MRTDRSLRALALWAGPSLLVVCVALLAGVRAPVQGQGQAAPKYKFDPETGKIVGEVPHVPETPQGQPFVAPTLPTRVPGQGSAGPVAGFITVPAAGAGGRGGRGNQAEAAAQAAAQQAAFRKKYPPIT